MTDLPKISLESDLRLSGNPQKSNRHYRLALQLDIPFDVSLSRDFLMGGSPNGPCDNVSGVDPSLRKTDGDAADFLNRPADQWR
jgi:hypothetical protein